MLEANNLKFSYGFRGFRIENVSLELEKGYVYALAGGNGAGKTTLLKLLYGALAPSSGQVFWKGIPVNRKTLADYHRETAFTGKKWCDNHRTIEENAAFFRALYPSFDDVYWGSLLESMGLTGIAETVQYGLLSEGEARKADIAFALARRPELLIMDEPLANLDPVIKTDITELLRDAVARDNLTILMSSNLIDEIRGLADFFGVINDGVLVCWGENSL